MGRQFQDLDAFNGEPMDGAQPDVRFVNGTDAHWPTGYGKSTFIRMLMPPELMAYYLDRLDFTTKKDAEKALTRFGLINIDEFDQISKSQTAYLETPAWREEQRYAA